MTEGGPDAEKRLILQELQKKLTEANASLKQARHPGGGTLLHAAAGK